MDPRARGKRTTTVRDRQHCNPSGAELGAYLSALPLIRPLPIVTPRPPLIFPMSTPPAPFAADEFVLHADLVYLKHAAVAPWPRRTAETEQRIAAETANGRTRLLAISAVQFASGLCMDLTALGAACRERGILFCIDAIQSLGALPLDVQAVQADFVVADGHKWLLGPEGLAVFYCRAPLREQLHLLQYGWHMVEALGDYDRRDWQAARSARRFECGSPNMLGIHALHARLSLLLEIGMEEITRRVLANSGYLLEHLAALPGVELLTPASPERHAGIVTFRHRDVDGRRLWQDLSTKGVVCAARGGGVRLSPHFYTTSQTHGRALDWVSRCTAAPMV